MWRDDLPALQERNRRDKELRAAINVEADKRAAIRRAARQKALKVLEDSGKLTPDELAVSREALV